MLSIHPVKAVTHSSLVLSSVYDLAAKLINSIAWYICVHYTSFLFAMPVSVSLYIACRQHLKHSTFYSKSMRL